MPQHGIEFESVAFRGVRGKGWRTLLLGPFALLRAFVAEPAHHPAPAPDVVLGLGGFASFPGRADGRRDAASRSSCTSERRRRARQRVLAHGADRVLLGFPGALRGRTRSARVGRQSGARRHRRASRRREQRFAGRTGRCACWSSAAASARRRLNDALPRGARDARRERAADRRAPGRRAAHRRAARGVRDARASTAECVPFIDDMARALR